MPISHLKSELYKLPFMFFALTVSPSLGYLIQNWVSIYFLTLKLTAKIILRIGDGNVI